MLEKVRNRRRLCSETLGPQEQQEGPWMPLCVGLFKTEKASKVSGEGHWRGISQTLHFHHDFPDLNFFPHFSLFLEKFIEWDLWSNIFKFLSNIWFCTSHVWAGFWQYFGRGWKQDKTIYALSPACFGCQASDVLGQRGRFGPASSGLLLMVTRAWVTISPPQLPCLLPGKSRVTHPVARPYRPRLIRAWHGLQRNTPNETFPSCWQGGTLPGAL